MLSRIFKTLTYLYCQIRQLYLYFTDLLLQIAFDACYLHQQFTFHRLHMLQEHLVGDIIRHGRQMVENLEMRSK